VANIQVLPPSHLCAPAVAAIGSVAFTVNPSASATLTISTTATTFVASEASGPQVNIGVDLATTLASLLAYLQASVDTELAKMSYWLAGTTLHIQAKTAGTAGNSLALATTVASATRSAATLAGGRASRAETEVNGRSYICTAGAALAVPDFDAQALGANGWLLTAKDGTGTTAQRPSAPLIDARYYDTDVGAILVYDGAAWLNAITGAVA
jgi:hypothetical protein